MKKELSITLSVTGVDELRELQAAAKERATFLENRIKQAANAYLPEEAGMMRRRLRLWNGDDALPGLIARLSEQLTAFDPAFSDDGQEPEGQQEIFDGVPKQADQEPTPSVPETITSAGELEERIATVLREKPDAKIQFNGAVSTLGEILADRPTWEKYRDLCFTLGRRATHSDHEAFLRLFPDSSTSNEVEEQEPDPEESPALDPTESLI